MRQTPQHRRAPSVIDPRLGRVIWQRRTADDGAVVHSVRRGRPLTARVDRRTSRDLAERGVPTLPSREAGRR